MGVTWTHRRVFWALLLLGVLVRLAFGAEVLTKRTGLHEAHPRDMWLYYAEADLVADGDWELRGTPDLLREHHSEGLGAATYLLSDLGRDHLYRVHGDAPLIHAPLYPWFVAALRLVNDSAYAVRLLQILATLLTAVLARELARRTSGSERVGLLTMALVLFHPTTVFYAAFLLRATLLTLLLLALILALSRACEEPRWRWAFACGVLLGVLHLFKAVTAVVLPVLALGVILSGAWRRVPPKHLAWALGGFFLLVSPLVARNLACGSPLLHAGSNAHPSIVMYNFEGADGLHLVRPTIDYTHALVSENDSQISVLLATLETHPSVGSVVNLFCRKLHGFWNAYEARNNVSISEYRPWLKTLVLFPASSLMILALSLLGLVVGARHARRLWPVFTGLALTLALCLVAATHARYRLPAVPFLAIFAAIGIESLLFRLRKGRRLLSSLALLALFVAVCHPAALSLTWKPGFPPVTTTPDPVSSLRSLSDQYALQGEAHAAADLALRSLDARLDTDLARPPLSEELILHVRWTYERCKATRDPALTAASLAQAERVAPELRARLEER